MKKLLRGLEMLATPFVVLAATAVAILLLALPRKDWD